MPRLTAKAAAELLHMPAYEYLRIITGQKYPRREPNSYRTPFYRPSLNAIASYFRQRNDQRVIAAAKLRAQNLRPDSKRTNNLRVLSSFEESGEYLRQLEIRPKREFEAEVDEVVIRLAPDFLVRENGEPKVMFYNCRTVAIPYELARNTIEIGHWILEENDVEIPITSFEYIDLIEKRVHTTPRRRKQTINRLRTNARVIKALWDSV